MNVEFKKGLTTDSLSGLFTEDGIVGMREETDHECFDMVSPFPGALVDNYYRDLGI